MDNNRKYRIALVIKTEGLEYDDRVRKEILTIQKLYPNITFKIHAIIDNDNRNYEGITTYGVPYKTYYLRSREKYGAAKGLVLKSLEFYTAMAKDIKPYDAIWCGDYHSFLVAAMVKQNKLLWDLHELPGLLLAKRPLRWLLKYIFLRCRLVVHANPQRAEYLQKIGIIKDMAKHYAIRNYPNFNDVDPVYDDNYRKFVEWKAGRKCIYLQGLNDDSRSAYESVSAVLKTKDLVAVVIGNFDQSSGLRLSQEWGEELADRICFIGRVPQLKIPQYVAECVTTLVFYKNVRPNNYYCEANRFYQSVILGLPVVVGNNPPMRELVEKYGFGVSIDDDGGDIQKIQQGIQNIFANYETYRDNNLKHRQNIIWDNQEPVFKEIIEKLLGKN